MGDLSFSISNEVDSFNSFKGLLNFLAVFYLKAFNNISGWKRSDKFNSSSSS